MFGDEVVPALLLNRSQAGRAEDPWKRCRKPARRSGRDSTYWRLGEIGFLLYSEIDPLKNHIKIWLNILLIKGKSVNISKMEKVRFEWDDKKDQRNQERHGVPFSLAQYAFADQNRIIAEDLIHSQEEQRYYCFGKVGDKIMTVRFTYRERKIRIIGAGYWRKGREIYENRK